MKYLKESVAGGALKPGSLVILDFKGIKGTNGSYIKGTALWLWTCGNLSTNGSQALSPPRHRADPRPYDLYPCVTGLAKELEAEFQEFFRPRKLPLLLAREMGQEVLEEAVLLGHLDPALRFTLNAATQKQRVTAPELYKANPNEEVTVTAWNNRLNDLYALRLLRRIRAGRVWQYEPLAKQITWE